jgi:hypothetical protein
MMNHAFGNQTHAQLYLCVIALVLAVAGLLVLQPFLGAHLTSSTATYSRGALHLTIPYHADHPGAGHLTLEVLDPENHVIGRDEKNLAIARGASQWKRIET